MKKSILAGALICTALLSSCFGTTGLTGTGTSASRPSSATNSSTTTATTSTTSATSTAGSAISSILSGVTSGSTSSLLGSVLGTFIGTTNANTIVGTWTYKEPTIQFDSDNLLAKAGGAVAGQSIVNKISPYYEKVGLKAGVAKITLNSDKTCQIALSSKTVSGTYEFDSSAGTLTVKGSTGLKLFTAYASVSLSQLALTLDTTNLLSLLQNVGSSSGNTTLSSISSISSSFNGMKTGFLFTK